MAVTVEISSDRVYFPATYSKLQHFPAASLKSIAWDIGVMALHDTYPSSIAMVLTGDNLRVGGSPVNLYSAS